MQHFSKLVRRSKHRTRNYSTDDTAIIASSASHAFIWAWGNLSHTTNASVTSRSSKTKQRTPKLAESLNTEHIKSITCNARHVIVVTHNGTIFLWELGKSLKKISKQFEHRPSSLRDLVQSMRNQLPIVSTFDITQLQPELINNPNPILQNRSTINPNLSLSVNKRIFYGCDAVKWLVDHESATNTNEAVRFCQALLNEGQMECANKYFTNTHMPTMDNTNKIFKNSKYGLYYFCDHYNKKYSNCYMQNFHSIRADPTLKFTHLASNQNYFYVLTENGKLYEWNLKEREFYLSSHFMNRIQAQFNNKKKISTNANENKQQLKKYKIKKYKHGSSHSQQLNINEYESDSDISGSNSDESLSITSHSTTDPLDISISNKNSNNKRFSHSFKKRFEIVAENIEKCSNFKNENTKNNKNNKNLNLESVNNVISDEETVDEEKKNQFSSLKRNLRHQQQRYEDIHLRHKRFCSQRKIHLQKTVKEVARTWVHPQEFFISGKIEEQKKNMSKETMSMLLIEKLSCAPTLVRELEPQLSICYVSCGHDYTIVLSNNGQLYAWGNTLYGRLGLNVEEYVSDPTLIQYFCDNNIIISRIECGFDHSVAISDIGRMYAWGSNQNGKLGIGDPGIDVQFVSEPLHVRIMQPMHNQRYHLSYLPSLMSDNDVIYNAEEITPFTEYESKEPYVNASVNVAHESMMDKYVNKCNSNVFEDEDLVFFVEISCGYSHNLAVVAGSCQVYSWGSNMCGQLGLKDRVDRCSPSLIQSLVKQSSMRLNPVFSSLSTKNNEKSAKMVDVKHPEHMPAVIENKSSDVNETLALNENPIIRVSCGAFHSCAISTVGNVFCWGDNTDGQLGIGRSCTECLGPQLVDYLSGMDSTMISCGSDFTIAVSDNFLALQSDYFHPSQQTKLKTRLHYYDGRMRKAAIALKTNMNRKLIVRKNTLNIGTGRPLGLPNKKRAELKKHKSEIHKIEMLFAKQKVREKHVFLNVPFGKSDIKISSDGIDIHSNFNFNHKTFDCRRVLQLNEVNVDKGYSKADREKAMQYWMKSILSNFDKHKNDVKLRQTVWKVGVPAPLRSRVWRMAVGNQLSISKALFEHFEERAKQMQMNEIENHNSDSKLANENHISTDLKLGKEKTISYISMDLPRTFPKLTYFSAQGPLNNTLHDLLQTYCFYRPDIGYIQGMTYLAANLLLYMDKYSAFVCFANLLNQPFFSALLSLNEKSIKLRYDIFLGILKENEPLIYGRFMDSEIRSSAFFLDWGISLFAKKLDINVTSRVWDVLLMFGELEFYRCSVAIFRCLRKQLLTVDIDHIRKQITLLPQTLKEGQLIACMKSIKISKKFKQKLHKLNSDVQ